MAKVAIIGAGSLVFCKTLMNDFLATPALAGSEYSLMALTHTRLDKMHAFVERMIADNGIDATVTKTTDRREALRDADYVVVMIQVGGVDAFKVDYEIPMRYGVDQCIGDTLALDTYCDEPSFGGETGAYYKYCVDLAEKFSVMDPLSIESTALEPRSAEYASHILEARETGIPFRFSANLRNDGYITNLPRGCCVEVPTYVDRLGLHPTVVGDLPAPCAALNMTNINVQGLAVKAGLEGDTEALVQAIALDPLTASVLTLRDIREMVSEMLEAQRAWLPQFHGKSVRSTPAIAIPADVTPVDVPLDPALAIAHRFGKLAEA